tara:strand:- start:164 stop:337 length:174 start_codon:yes stop_codon:yes gene_type:complete
MVMGNMLKLSCLNMIMLMGINQKRSFRHTLVEDAKSPLQIYTTALVVSIRGLVNGNV